MTKSGAVAEYCQTCDGTGWERTADNRVRRCACWWKKQRTYAIGVPKKLADANLSNYLELPGNVLAIAAARAWLTADRGDLYLWGGVGTGKSRLACSLLNELFHRGSRDALFVDVPTLVRLQLQGFDDAGKKAQANELFDQCVAASWLVLDDVGGGEKGSDFSRGTLVTLYNGRINEGRRTIWTSNLDLGKLQQFYRDDRLPSRIAGEVGETIQFTCEDFRVRA